MEALGDTCISCPIYDIEQAVNDPQIKARGAVIEMPMPLPSGGQRQVRLPNNPVRLSRTNPKVERPASWVGEDTRAILTEVLGLSDKAVAELERSGAVRARER